MDRYFNQACDNCNTMNNNICSAVAEIGMEKSMIERCRNENKHEMGTVYGQSFSTWCWSRRDTGEKLMNEEIEGVTKFKYLGSYCLGSKLDQSRNGGIHQ